MVLFVEVEFVVVSSGTSIMHDSGLAEHVARSARRAARHCKKCGLKKSPCPLLLKKEKCTRRKTNRNEKDLRVRNLERAVTLVLTVLTIIHALFNRGFAIDCALRVNLKATCEPSNNKNGYLPCCSNHSCLSQQIPELVPRNC